MNKIGIVQLLLLFTAFTLAVSIKCNFGCKCDETNSCTTCKDGFFKNGDKCSKCLAGCKKCDSMNNCTQAAKGKLFNGGSLKQCKLGCQQCDTKLCINALPRFYIKQNRCLRCIGNCLTCDSSDPSLCLSCPPSYSLLNGKCQSCTDSSCVRCPQNASICQSCKKGYLLSNTSQCIKSVKNCAKTSVNLTCLECNIGYGLTLLGECWRCLSTCGGKCDPKDITKCLQCPNGQQLIDGSCVYCSEGCNKCSGGSCEECEALYSPVVLGGVVKCELSCLPPCSVCNNGVCTNCLDGFTLKDNICEKKQTCGCTDCPLGYVNVSGSCQSCPTNCKVCDTDLVCQSCFFGYFYDENTTLCKPCGASCNDCVNEDVCNVCKKGYFRQLIEPETDLTPQVLSDVCTICKAPCKTCVESEDKCTSCIKGYKRQTNHCVSSRRCKFRFRFRRDYNQFLQQGGLQALIKKFLQKLNGVKQSNCFFHRMSPGSVILEGEIGTEPGQSAEQIKQLLNDNQNDLGLTVEESSIEVVSDDQEKKTNIGLIVGVIVGGFFFVMILLLLVYFCYLKPKNQIQEKEFIPFGHDQNGSGNMVKYQQR